jgi:hypothetical protein
MRTSVALTPVATLALIAVPLSAQSPPPVRQLGAVTAKSKETFANFVGVRPLSDGRVLVNDVQRRRVLLLDSTLSSFTIVADSTPGTGNAYGGRVAGLIRYRGDSTLFVDPQSLSMLVIDPAGKIGRVMSVPRADDVMSLAGPIGGAVGFDKSGRLVYRAFPRIERRGPPPQEGGHFTPPQFPDSAPVVRVELATRQLDTVGFLKIPRPNMQVTRDADGRMQFTTTVNPLPIVDEWAVLSDGSIALVRGRDYHIDWVHPDGTRSSAPKMPFEWQRLTDEDKVAFIDSVKAARERMGAGGVAQLVMGGGPPVAGSRRDAPAPAPGAGTGDRVQVTIVQGGAGGAPPGGTATRGTQMTTSQLSFVSPSELPDYKPPFFAGAALADTDGNLWIRTIPTKGMPRGGLVYDVVNRERGFIDRVQVPAGRMIVGFGPGGVVYLTSREGEAMVLERARVK